MTSVFSWQTLLTLALLHFVFKANFPYFSRYLLTFCFAFQSPIMKRTSFGGVSSRRSCRSSQNCSTSASLQIIWKTLEFSNKVLPRERTGHSKHPLPTTQEKTIHMDITRWSISKSDWLYSLQSKMEKLYIVSKNKTGSCLWLRSWTPYCQIQTEIEESRENH